MPAATETANAAPSSASASTASRRLLRRTLNDALAIAGNAVQLDTAGDYARSIEAYQQSVELLDQGIALMRLQRESGSERPGRDTTHEISQLEQIVSLTFIHPRTSSTIFLIHFLISTTSIVFFSVC
jgi:hypothetical protein